MKKYAYSYVSLFDNELKMGLLSAPSYIEALKQAYFLAEGIEPTSAAIKTFFGEAETEEEIKQVYFNGDMFAEVLELP